MDESALYYAKVSTISHLYNATYARMDVPHSLTHNYALLTDSRGRYHFAGGTFAPGAQHKRGIQFGVSSDFVTWKFSAHHIISGSHAGCMECRPSYPTPFGSRDFNSQCEFDGRLTMVRFGKKLLLYARANRGVSRRGLQVCQLRGAQCSAFEQVVFHGLPSDDNIYYANIVAQWQNNQLVAAFSHVADSTATIWISVSRDGRNFYAERELLRSPAVDGRSDVMPVNGYVPCESDLCLMFQKNVFIESRSCLTLLYFALRHVFRFFRLQYALDVIWPRAAAAGPSLMLVKIDNISTLNGTLPTKDAEECDISPGVYPRDPRPVMMIQAALWSSVLCLYCAKAERR